MLTFMKQNINQKVIRLLLCIFISELDMIGTYAHTAVSNMSRKKEGGGHLRTAAVPSICSAFRLTHIGPRFTNEKHGGRLYHETKPNAHVLMLHTETDEYIYI